MKTTFLKRLIHFLKTFNIRGYFLQPENSELFKCVRTINNLYEILDNVISG